MPTARPADKLALFFTQARFAYSLITSFLGRVSVHTAVRQLALFRSAGSVRSDASRPHYKRSRRANWLCFAHAPATPSGLLPANWLCFAWLALVGRAMPAVLPDTSNLTLDTSSNWLCFARPAPLVVTLSGVSSDAPTGTVQTVSPVSIGFVSHNWVIAVTSVSLWRSSSLGRPNPPNRRPRSSIQLSSDHTIANIACQGKSGDQTHFTMHR